MRPLISLILLFGVAVFLSCSTQYTATGGYKYHFKQMPYSVISGRVLSVENDAPVPARVSFPGTVLQSIECDRYGVFVATVPPGTYLVKIDAPDYFTETFPVILAEGKSQTQEFLLRPRCWEQEKDGCWGQTDQCGDVIYFDPGSSYIKGEFLPVLDHAAMVIRTTAPALVEIRGFTDSVGDQFTNQFLSQQRAEAVKCYLIQRGVDPERLVVKGFGEYPSMYDNRTHSGKIMNRRVELAFIGF